MLAGEAVAGAGVHNILADTPGGDPNKTIVVGAHLDSVDEGAGINDNGSGSGTILELAEQFTALGITPKNRVRFAWFGAEESGLIGSTAYYNGLSPAEKAQIGLNLNFDMLASPNFVRFVYDGDFSDTTRPAGNLAPGSADVEDAFNAYFASQGLATLPSAFDGRSDYRVFQDAGIPAGGLFTGAEVVKTAEQAAVFGGTAGIAYDPNYHAAGDDINNLNMTGWDQMSDAAATVILQYSMADTLPAKYSPTARRSEPAAGGGEQLGDRLQR